MEENIKEKEELEETQAVETEKTETEKKKTKKKDKNAEKIQKLEEDLAKEKDARLRLMAEYDNYRKRTSAEKLGIYGDATAKTVEALLPVADSLTMALNSMENAPEEFKKCFDLFR